MVSILDDLAVERGVGSVYISLMGMLNSINFLSTLFNFIYLKGTLPM